MAEVLKNCNSWAIYADTHYFIRCKRTQLSVIPQGMVTLINQMQTRGSVNDMDYDSDTESHDLLSKLPPINLWESDLILGILYNRFAANYFYGAHFQPDWWSLSAALGNQDV